MVTLKQIASTCGVSVATVSKALNRAPDISAETTERICRVAHELGYYPNSAARALKTNRSYSIGLLFEDETHSGLTHEYFTELLNAVKNEVERAGYSVSFISKNIGGREMSYLEHCKYRSCDGVVIASVDFTDPSVGELANSSLPVVTVDYIFNSCSAVMSDNVQGMRDLTEYMYAQGHRRIAFIHGEDTAVTRARVASFRQSCIEHGIDVPEEYIIEGRYHDPKRSGLATRQLLSMKNPPTCILYPDDISLLGGMTEIERSGLSIPEDISIAGYDGVRMTRYLRPVITSLRQDSETLGALAAKLLLDRIENPETFVPQIANVPGQVQEGGTVSKPRRE